MTSTTACRLAAALLAAGGLIGLTPARAQIYGGPPVMGGQPGTGHAPPAPRKPAAPPAPALPGSHASEPAAPAARLPLDMPPTEALFDAINRGDLAAARDAISRGADLNGKNVLGLSPLELSVDLGRNQITFLLLSMRHVGGAERTRPVTVAEPAPERQPRRHGREPAGTAELATMPASGPPRLGGGTPVPSAGFLGFDFGARSAR